MTQSFPITDEHMHIDLRSKGLKAVKEFQNAGGTHIFLVMKPKLDPGDQSHKARGPHCRL